MFASEEESTKMFEMSVIFWTAPTYEQTRSGQQTLKQKRTPKLQNITPPPPPKNILNNLTCVSLYNCRRYKTYA